MEIVNGYFKNCTNSLRMHNQLTLNLDLDLAGGGSAVIRTVERDRPLHRQQVHPLLRLEVRLEQRRPVLLPEVLHAHPPRPRARPKAVGLLLLAPRGREGRLDRDLALGKVVSPLGARLVVGLVAGDAFVGPEEALGRLAGLLDVAADLEGEGRALDLHAVQVDVDAVLAAGLRGEGHLEDGRKEERLCMLGSIWIYFS